jgi:hypothetical protein
LASGCLCSEAPCVWFRGHVNPLGAAPETRQEPEAGRLRTRGERANDIHGRRAASTEGGTAKREDRRLCDGGNAPSPLHAPTPVCVRWLDLGTSKGRRSASKRPLCVKTASMLALGSNVASDTSADKCFVSSWFKPPSRCCHLASVPSGVDAPRFQKYRAAIVTATKGTTTAAVSWLGFCTQVGFCPVAVTPGTRLSIATARCTFRAAWYWALADRVAGTARRAGRWGGRAWVGCQGGEAAGASDSRAGQHPQDQWPPIHQGQHQAIP